MYTLKVHALIKDGVRTEGEKHLGTLLYLSKIANRYQKCRHVYIRLELKEVYIYEKSPLDLDVHFYASLSSLRLKCYTRFQYGIPWLFIQFTDDS